MSGLYSTSRWVKRRAWQLRNEPVCRICVAQGLLTEATVADHIIPHRQDPTLFWTGELQSLCKRCHDSAKQSEEKLGYRKGVGVDGYPVDPKHPWNNS